MSLCQRPQFMRLLIYAHTETKFCVMIKVGEKEVFHSSPYSRPQWPGLMGKIVILMRTCNLFAVTFMVAHFYRCRLFICSLILLWGISIRKCPKLDKMMEWVVRLGL